MRQGTFYFIEPYTPLIAAAADGHAETVDFLLKAGANIEAAHNDGGTALYCAVAAGHPDALKVLMEAGAKLEVTNGGGQTPIMIACWNPHESTGKLECVSLLIEAGAKLESTDHSGKTPLMAAADGNPKAISLLLDAGAEIEARNIIEMGESALWIACRRGRLDCVRVLLEAGADIEAMDKNGQTPLFACCIGKEQYHWGLALYPSCIEELIASGANMEHQNQYGTPLMVACRNKMSACASVLISSGSNVNARGNDSTVGLGRYRKAKTLIIKMRDAIFHMTDDKKKKRLSQMDYPDVDILEFGIEQCHMFGATHKALSAVADEQLSDVLINQMLEFACPLEFLKMFASTI